MRITLKEYAEATGVSIATAYRHANQGKIEWIKEGNATYVILGESQVEKLFGDQEKQRLAEENQRLLDEKNWLKERYEEQTQQLQTKDEHISELHQLVAMEQRNLGEITQQLTQTQNLLEDLRKPRSWWQFWQKNGK